MELEGLAILLAACSTSYLAAYALFTLRARLQVTSAPRLLRKPLVFLGLSVAISATASARERRAGLPLPPHSHSQAPPWSEPGGYFPPHPPGRAGADSSIKADLTAAGDDGRRAPRSVPRPAAPVPQSPGTYLVSPGESLWSIAEHWLDTDDPGRIARYWPRIHRANRSTIADPNLIHPGQVLVMPPERDADVGG